MFSIYKSHIFLYGIRATSLTSHFQSYQWSSLLLLTLLWNLSQQLNYSLNYLSQIIPPGTSKLLYCSLQIIYSTMFLAPFHVLQQQLKLVTQLLKIPLFLTESVRIMICFWLSLVHVVLRHGL